MSPLATVDLVGFWLGIFLTFCILSFLYKDNPFYKFAEHLFIGVSIGYVVIQQYYNVIRPKIFEEMAAADHWWLNWTWIPLVLIALMFVKVLSKKLSWMGRYPLAFVVALYAGLQINGIGQADLQRQMVQGMSSLDDVRININRVDAEGFGTLPGVSPAAAAKIYEHRTANGPFKSIGDLERVPSLTPAERADISDKRGHVIGIDSQASLRDGHRDYFGIFSKILLLLGLLAALVYFYFSIEHKGVIGRVSRFGVWILMIGFGASFGLTVMSRQSLAIGRIQNIRGDFVPAAMADQIHGPWVALISIAIIVVGLVIWEFGRKSSDGEGPAGRGKAPTSPLAAGEYLDEDVPDELDDARGAADEDESPDDDDDDDDDDDESDGDESDDGSASTHDDKLAD